MGYNEIVERLEAIEAKTSEMVGFDTSVKDALVMGYEVNSMVNDLRTAIDDDRDREAAMIAEFEDRLDAEADAVSAGWGHD